MSITINKIIFTDNEILPSISASSVNECKQVAQLWLGDQQDNE